MNKKRAKEILIANACCTYSDMCNMCPWENTEDCKNTKFSDVLEEVINVMKGMKL